MLEAFESMVGMTLLPYNIAMGQMVLEFTNSKSLAGLKRFNMAPCNSQGLFDTKLTKHIILLSGSAAAASLTHARICQFPA